MDEMGLNTTLKSSVGLWAGIYRSGTFILKAEGS